MILPAHVVTTLRPFYPRLILMVCSGVVMAMVTIAGPWVVGQFSDLLLIEGSSFDIGVMLGVLLLLVSVRAILQFVTVYIAARVYAEMSAALRATVFNHLAQLSLGWHADRRQGEHVSLVTADVEQITSFVSGTCVQLVPTLITLGGVTVIIGVQYPLLSLGLVLSIPVIYLFLRRVNRFVDHASTQSRGHHADMYGRMLDLLYVLPTIKAYGLEPLASEQVFAANERVILGNKRLHQVQSLVTPLTQFVGLLMVMFLLWFGSGQFLANQMTPGEMVSLVLYMVVMVRPAGSLAQTVTEISAARGALRRLDEAMQQPAEASPGKLVIETVQRSLRFREVRFSYPGKPPLFSDISIRIPAGSVLGLTGPNGAGKTTLTNLLVRFAEPSEGSIQIDGIDITELKLSSLRQMVAYAQQDTQLLNDSIAANVRIGQPDATDEEVVQALELAQARVLLQGLPDGIETMVGDNGVKLSGGERQRIGLARVFVSNRPIVVLDEATSMFDMVAEKALVMVLRDWLKNRVTILITHRPALLTLADKVVRLKDGSVSRVMNHIEIGL